eukprot:COSAG02_NODE_35103_length_473_cov_80.368984_1_plen_77_part_01
MPSDTVRSATSSDGTTTCESKLVPMGSIDEFVLDDGVLLRCVCPRKTACRVIAAASAIWASISDLTLSSSCSSGDIA